MATVIDKLLVEIGVDNKGLKKGVKDTENQVKKIGKTETDLADKKKKRQKQQGDREKTQDGDYEINLFFEEFAGENRAACDSERYAKE